MTCEVWAVSTVLNQIFSKKSASKFVMASSLHACAPVKQTYTKNVENR